MTLTRLAALFELLPVLVGRAAAWLVIVTVGTCAFVAIARYGFGYGNICLQEIYVAAFGVSFMLVAPLAWARDAHVRIDVLNRRWSPRRRALVELLGCAFMVLPWLGLILWSATPFLRLTWLIFEPSPQAGGCALVPVLGWPLPFYALLKSVLVAFVGLMTLQALAVMLRSVAILKHGERQ